MKLVEPNDSYWHLRDVPCHAPPPRGITSRAPWLLRSVQVRQLDADRQSSPLLFVSGVGGACQFEADPQASLVAQACVSVGSGSPTRHAEASPRPRPSPIATGSLGTH